MTPGGDELVVKYDDMVCFLGRDMSNRGDIYQLPTASPGYIAANEEFIYTNVDDFTIHCFTQYGAEVLGAEVAEYESPDKCIDCHTLAPGGLLFCVLFDTDDTQDEIIALDAQTLQPRHRFGLSLLNIRGMVVVGEELFVGDTGNDRLQQVFFTAGEHRRRSITGEWKRPSTLCFVKDRSISSRRLDDDEDDEGNLINPLQGARIFVLSLQGDTLQVYTHPVEGQIFNHLCCFDGKLLAPVRDRRVQGITKEVVALCVACSARV